MRNTRALISFFIFILLLYSGCEGYGINVFENTNIPGPNEINKCMNTISTEINNQAELESISLSGNYCLTQNISLKGAWTPLGDFRGRFEGNNKTISGIRVNRSTDSSGLFATIQAGALIKNLTIQGPNITGKYYTGALSGKNYGTIDNVNIAGGNINGANNVGGLVGLNSGSITNSSASARVTGTGNNAGNYVGGLVGQLDASGSITKSFAGSSVNGTSFVGVLVGTSFGRITNSYATGTVRGSANDIGGLVGQLGAGTIQNSYARVSTTGPGNKGGLVGSKSQGTITNSYWDKNNTAIGIGTGNSSSSLIGVSGAGSISKNATGYIETGAQTPIFVGWDFNSVWSGGSGRWPNLQ